MPLPPAAACYRVYSMHALFRVLYRQRICSNLRLGLGWQWVGSYVH